MANPGPATTVTANSIIDSQNALRLIAFAKNVSVAAAGDTQMNVVTPSNFVATQVVTCNSAGTTANIAAATLGIFTAPGAAGTTVHATAALTGQTTATFAFVRAASVANAMIQASSLFVNVGTTVAGGQTDVYLYGFDVQP